MCPTGGKEESCKPRGTALGGPTAQCRRPYDRVCCAWLMRLGRRDLKAAQPLLVVLGPHLCCRSQAEFAAAPSGQQYRAPAPAFSPPHPRPGCGGRRVRPCSWLHGLHGRLSARNKNYQSKNYRVERCALDIGGLKGIDTCSVELNPVTNYKANIPHHKIAYQGDLVECTVGTLHTEQGLCGGAIYDWGMRLLKDGPAT
ncbi:hypothetical protein NDU88_007225 [Pleurodeles waltl]|uniref:Uncharacterized protein n=1 Tax=Pleurodeles waltl TaxID=8319 RepID=A0AAV7N1G9_PLEWA|nr:hypothetical protein NDU88_007225 [Pleurodeles waltl]